jgi:hypothetical protein
MFESGTNPPRKHLLHQVVKELGCTRRIWPSQPTSSLNHATDWATGALNKTNLAVEPTRFVHSHIWLNGSVSVRTA